MIIHQKIKEHISKKWSLVSLLVLAGTLVVLGICAVAVLGIIDETHVPPVETGKVTPGGMAVQNYDISYPIFHVEKVDAALRNYATHQADDFLRELGNDPRDTLKISYTILHVGTQTVTVEFHQREQVYGKVPASSQKLLTFDLKAQKQLAVGDLFKNKTAANIFLARILHDYFGHITTAHFTPMQLDQLSKFTLKDVRNFVVSDDSLILFTNPLNPVSPQKTRAIAIKKSLLADVLNTAFVAPDKSLAQGYIAKPAYAITTMPKHETLINPKKKMLALTFDDGPGIYTSHLLDVLKQDGAHATFFVVGSRVAPFAGIVKREVAEGHEVGNHSWSHPDLTALSAAGLHHQIDDTQQAVRRATGGYAPVLMRPPYGAINPKVSSYLASRGLSMTLWNVDTQDWLYPNADYVYQEILAQARDGAVVLLHDIHPTSVQAAIRAIPELQARGYQLVTVSQLRNYR